MHGGKTLAESYHLIFNKIKSLVASAMTPNSKEIASILSGTYVSSGSDGEGEKNGVPTSKEIAAILNDTYVHADKELDEFAPKDVTSAEDVKKILDGTY